METVVMSEDRGNAIDLAIEEWAGQRFTTGGYSQARSRQAPPYFGAMDYLTTGDIERYQRATNAGQACRYSGTQIEGYVSPIIIYGESCNE